MPSSDPDIIGYAELLDAKTGRVIIVVRAESDGVIGDAILEKHIDEIAAEGWKLDGTLSAATPTVNVLAA